MPCLLSVGLLLSHNDPTAAEARLFHYISKKRARKNANVAQKQLYRYHTRARDARAGQVRTVLPWNHSLTCGWEKGL